MKREAALILELFNYFLPRAQTKTQKREYRPGFSIVAANQENWQFRE